MQFVDPIKQPQRFIQQADALVRQSFAEPGGVDAVPAPEAESPAQKPAGGPVSLPGAMMGMSAGQLPWVPGTGAPGAAWPMTGMNPLGGVGGIGAASSWPTRPAVSLGAPRATLISPGPARHPGPPRRVGSVV